MAARVAVESLGYARCGRGWGGGVVFVIIGRIIMYRDALLPARLYIQSRTPSKLSQRMWDGYVPTFGIREPSRTIEHHYRLPQFQN